MTREVELADLIVHKRNPKDDEFDLALTEALRNKGFDVIVYRPDTIPVIVIGGWIKFGRRWRKAMAKRRKQ